MAACCALGAFAELCLCDLFLRRLVFAVRGCPAWGCAAHPAFVAKAKSALSPVLPELALQD